MKILKLLIVILFIFCVKIYAQSDISESNFLNKVIVTNYAVNTPEKGIVNISGIILDEKDVPLPYVSIALPALHRGIISDDNGKFIIENLYPGVYVIEFTLIGYKKETRSVVLSSKDIELRITLNQSSLVLPGIIVTGKPQPSDILSSSQSISTVGGRELNRLRGQNVMQTLQYSPGVSVYSTGNGIAKPVIRGLTSQRVLVISDGIRQEGQQWGDEHGPEIDAFDIERIEVLRGPGSVIYGSDALGGVVNIIKHDLPSLKEGYPSLGGEIKFNSFSNNDHIAGDLSLFGAKEGFGYRGHFSFREAGDISTPEGKLYNSGIKEMNGGALIGFKEEWGTLSLDYSNFGQELQIHENPAEDPTATPFQKIKHEKVHFHGDLPYEVLRLELDASWQKNIRKEFEDENAAVPVLRLDLNTYSFDMKGHHFPIGSLFGTIGLSILAQNNKSLSEEKIIPGFNVINLAGYIYEESQIGKFNLSAGIRYDLRKLKINQSEELNVEAQTRNYNSITGTVGLVYRLSEPISFALNIGRGWRAPTPFELFVNGVHEGTVRYEIGDENLKNEISLNTDLSVRYISNKMQFELTIFQNNIGNYIFLSPTGDIDTVSGYPMYLNKQADAKLTGAELSLKMQTTDWLMVNGGYNYVRGRNTLTDKPLPLIPANSFWIGTMFTIPSFAGVLNPYMSFDAKVIASQNRIEIFETRTGGYTIFNAGIGGEIAIGIKRMSVDISIENLFDKSYREHLNRYKEYALNPGRNVRLELSVPFTLLR